MPEDVKKQIDENLTYTQSRIPKNIKVVIF